MHSTAACLFRDLAFYLGHFPDRQFLSFLATSEFAGDFGRDMRSIMGSQEYATLYKARLAEDSQAKGRWHTTEGGIYYTVGVGGSVMGKGAHVALIDDPFASMQDAYSKATRERGAPISPRSSTAPATC